ncbi:MAG: hypothetical protein ACOY5B_04985 [Spirochaetota bacterium]
MCRPNFPRTTSLVVSILLLVSCANDKQPSPENSTGGDTFDLMGGAYTKNLQLTGTVTSFAGTGATGSLDGARNSATFSSPYGITSDGQNLYITDSLNHRIRKINISSGAVTTIAGSVSGFYDGIGSGGLFNTPIGITTDNKSLFVADYGNHRIRRVNIATLTVTTLAGSVAGYADGWGTGALFNYPNGITTDGKYLYVVDQNNHRIRKIDIETQEVTTVAGSSAGFSDGTGSAALFDFPTGITRRGDFLFVSDGNNNRIRRVAVATRAVSTIAGGTGGATDGTGAAAQFSFPFHLTSDNEFLYLVDQNNHRIRKIGIDTGIVTTLAGAGASYSDGTGAGAQFNLPRGIGTDGKSLYVIDQNNGRVRKIN